MLVLVDSNAVLDLAEGAIFYEEQQSGLGEEFLRSLRSDIQRLENIGGIHSRAAADRYRMVSQRFGSLIYYRVLEEVVHVDAVVDGRRGFDFLNRRFVA